MSSILKILGALAAFMGRAFIIANAQRALQYTTDEYIKFVGGGLVSILVAIGINATLMFLGATSFQIILAILVFPVMIYYMAVPKVAMVVIGAGAANDAAQEGDQENVWLLKDGGKLLVRIIGTILFWVEVYIVVTIVTPFDLYPGLFWLMHVLVFCILALLMTGHVPVNPKVYIWGFRITVTALFLGIFAVVVFQERIGPWWAELAANQTTRIEAKKDSEAIRKSDKATAEWINKNVFVNDRGDQVVIINGKAVDAQPYIEEMKRRRSQAIERTKEGEKSITHQVGKFGEGVRDVFISIEKNTFLWTGAVLFGLLVLWYAIKHKILGRVLLVIAIGYGAWYFLGTNTEVAITGMSSVEQPQQNAARDNTSQFKPSFITRNEWGHLTAKEVSETGTLGLGFEIIQGSAQGKRPIPILGLARGDSTKPTIIIARDPDAEYKDFIVEIPYPCDQSFGDGTRGCGTTWRQHYAQKEVRPGWFEHDPGVRGPANLLTDQNGVRWIQLFKDQELYAMYKVIVN